VVAEDALQQGGPVRGMPTTKIGVVSEGTSAAPSRNPFDVAAIRPS
jgi:hypothetical protein